MDMEIQFLHEIFADKDPKLLMDHFQRMASGEAPFFAGTLSLVYDGLVEKTFTRPTSSSPGLKKPIEGQGIAVPTPPLQASTSTSNVPSPSTPSDSLLSSLQTPNHEPEPEPEPAPGPWVWLQCNQCGNSATKVELYDGLRCPDCPPRGGKKGRPYMQCPLCNVVRVTPRDICVKILCRARFV